VAVPLDGTHHVAFTGSSRKREEDLVRSKTMVLRARTVLGILAMAGLVLSGAPMAGAAPVAVGKAGPAPTAGTPVRECESLGSESLATLQDAPTSITSAVVVPAAEDVPEYCRITGYVLPQIQFEVRLPTQNWNGKYFQAGCGGFCGTIPIAGCAEALSRNYAVAAENSGHVGSIFDGLWGYDSGDRTNPYSRQLEIDWGYRSPHVVSIAAKALVQLYYGAPPKYSYFQGCSTGGRQALMEAQRFPNDFDGIIAGAPAMRQNYLAPVAQSYLERSNGDENGNAIFTPDRIPVLHEAVMAACDTIDGRADGVLDDPRKCEFDPGSVQCVTGADTADCLTAAEVEVVRKFYGGARNSAGELLFPGLPKGSELGWASGQGSLGVGQELSGSGKYALNVLRYLAFKHDPGPSYMLDDFDYDTDIPKLAYMARIYNSDNPDMRRFRNGGGKLIMYHGWADPLITAYSTTSYYDEVVRSSGGLKETQKWFRTFMLPGVWHCSGGPGADQVDWLSAIEDWVEGKDAPRRMTAEKVVDGEVTQTRVVRPYPASPLE
jgi:Tannase and feruloyl esterase